VKLSRDVAVTVRRFWSVIHGGSAARVSAHNARGDEHFAVVNQSGTARENRAARTRAAERVTGSVRRGAEPGPVSLDESLEDLKGGLGACTCG
jgi:hypothetical protein